MVLHKTHSMVFDSYINHIPKKESKHQNLMQLVNQNEHLCLQLAAILDDIYAA